MQIIASCSLHSIQMQDPVVNIVYYCVLFLIWSDSWCLWTGYHIGKNCATGYMMNKCDMIKGNESDVGNIDFELQAKRGDQFLCFSLFLNFEECSYLRNQIPDWDGVWIKM